MAKERDYDLVDRFIDYSVRIIAVCDALPDTKAGRHVCSQLLRSGTSPAPNYAEGQSAESRADFIHKLKIALKELRESLVWLRVAQRATMICPAERLEPLIVETDELIAILFRSVETARENQKKPRIEDDDEN